MIQNHKKNTCRKMGIFVGISTTLFSICGPILQTVAIAEETNQSSAKKLSSLPDVTSVINYDTEFSSTLDSSFIEETSDSSIAETEESTTSSSSEGTVPSDTSSSSQSTTDSSSQTSSSSSTSISTSTSNSNSFSSSSSNSNEIKGTSSISDKNTSTSSSKKDDLIGKNINGVKKPISYTRNQSTAEFIEEIGEDARVIGQKKDLYASVMIAQAILESGSGNSGLAKGPNYNLFGIKGSYEGESVQMATLEDNGSGSMYTINAKFRKYPSYKESLEDYATLMTGGTQGRSTFYQGAWKSNTNSYEEATKFLTGRYATDTRYNEKLNGLIETYDLTQYDYEKSTEAKIKKSKETELFIDEISKDAQKIAKDNDLYASVLIAEAIIQSTSGNNILAEKNNIYLAEGAFEDKSIEVETLLQKDKETKLEKVTYKEYPSYESAITDYVDELKKDKDSYEEMTMSKKNNYKKVTAYLTAKKNNDRKYHKKMNALIATYELTKFDEKVKKAEPVVAKDNTKKKTENIDIINKIGQTMTDKMFEGFENPIKYQVTKK